MQYSKPEDIITLAAQEAKISKEHLEVIVKDFWQTIRLFLTNPLNTKKGILISEFGQFYIKPVTVIKKRILLIKRNPESPQVEIHDKLIKQLTE